MMKGAAKGCTYCVWWSLQAVLAARADDDKVEAKAAARSGAEDKVAGDALVAHYRESLTKVFQWIDADGGGEISVNEFTSAIR